VVIGNLAVALAITAFQVLTLIAKAELRGIDFHATASGVGWFVGASILLAVGMYGAAETLAGRVPKQEEYIARVLADAIVPRFLAGLYSHIKAPPSALTWITRFLPLTHGLALMRYGLLGDGRAWMQVAPVARAVRRAGFAPSRPAMRGESGSDRPSS